MKRWILGAAASLAASPAWAAGVCALERPDWDGVRAPWSLDLVELLITPVGLALICVVCVALMLGRAWLLAAAAVFALALALWRYLGADAAVRAMGAEGCGPNPLLTAAALLVAAAALGALAFWRRRVLSGRAA